MVSNGLTYTTEEVRKETGSCTLNASSEYALQVSVVNEGGSFCLLRFCLCGVGVVVALEAVEAAELTTLAAAAAWCDYRR